MGLSLQMAQHFLLCLALGLGLFSPLADTAKTGVGFYKVILAVMGGALSLSFALHLPYHEMLSIHSGLYFLAFGILLSLFYLHKDRRGPLMWVFYATKIVALALISFLFAQKNGMNYLYLISSMLFLGSVTLTMILGHWYLVTPKLSERPLLQGLKMIWFIAGLKIALGLWDHFQMQVLPGPEATASMGISGASLQLVVVAMRVIWGYVITIVLSYFAWRLVKMRSLQSATGIFYVMTFFVFVGETISAFLFYQDGLML
ncbi:MAG: hypothetical protein OXB88_00930 [Bacteriovoracales bacterium]|nr:hypothetical protein [Bacteriovoracales bacterium]